MQLDYPCSQLTERSVAFSWVSVNPTTHSICLRNPAPSSINYTWFLGKNAHSNRNFSHRTAFILFYFILFSKTVVENYEWMLFCGGLKNGCRRSPKAVSWHPGILHFRHHNPKGGSNALQRLTHTPGSPPGGRHAWQHPGGGGWPRLKLPTKSLFLWCSGGQTAPSLMSNVVP